MMRTGGPQSTGRSAAWPKAAGMRLAMSSLSPCNRVWRICVDRDMRPASFPYLRPSCTRINLDNIRPYENRNRQANSWAVFVHSTAMCTAKRYKRTKPAMSWLCKSSYQMGGGKRSLRAGRLQAQRQPAPCSLTLMKARSRDFRPVSCGRYGAMFGVGHPDRSNRVSCAPRADNGAN